MTTDRSKKSEEMLKCLHNLLDRQKMSINDRKDIIQFFELMTDRLDRIERNIYRIATGRVVRFK